MAGFQKLMDWFNPPPGDFDDDVNIKDDDITTVFTEDKKSSRRRRITEDDVEEKPARSVDIHTTAHLCVIIEKPETFGSETRNTADELLKGRTVVLNLESTNKADTVRILDFLSGVAYANMGKLMRIASRTFIITPNNVDLSGDDLMDELESSGIYL